MDCPLLASAAVPVILKLAKRLNLFAQCSLDSRPWCSQGRANKEVEAGTWRLWESRLWQAAVCFLPLTSNRFLPLSEGNSLLCTGGWSFLPREESRTVVPDTEGSFGAAAQALLSIYVTFSTWCESWCYNILRVQVVAELRENPLSHTVVPSDPTFTACGLSSFLWTEAPRCAMKYHGVMQSSADEALGHMCVLGWELPFSRAEDVFSFIICKTPCLPRSLPKAQSLGHCDPMSYNRAVFEVLPPLFLSYPFILHSFKHKGPEKPKGSGVTYSAADLGRS